ncbi:MAG: endonuclease III [Candidatus Bathyarchaeota archaeon]|nr:MAG: endonuclease III [Candidatus Bathyarchaeota archaeon]
MEGRGRIKAIIRLLNLQYPNAEVALRYSNPFELLVATVLSAQSTDKTVNKVTRNLFQKYRKPEDYASVNLEELEDDIRSTGFYRNKAKHLRKIGQILVEQFKSKVPRTMKELVALPGVGRKTANIVLTKAFGISEGIAVDTHVQRLTGRLGLTNNRDPSKIEKDLMDLVPRENWPILTDLLIFHGRRICTARKPDCNRCVLNHLCPSAFVP